MEQEFFKSPRPVRKLYLLLYIFSAISLIAVTITALSLHEWFTYCYWNFGLVRASTTQKDSAFKNQNTIADVRAGSCYGLKDTIQAECPSFCNFPTRFELGGAFIIILSIISIISQIFSVFYHFLRYKKADFQLSSINFLICFTFSLQFVGYLGYYFIGGFVSLKGTHNIRLDSIDPTDFEWKAGNILFVILLVAQFSLMMFGLFFTSKAFK